MGGLLSLAARDTPPPPSVVLVPPLLERDRKGRSRYSKSSYDCLFSKPQLSALFDDYLYQDVRAVLHFSPQQEDQHVSVVAKLGVPQRTGAAMAEASGEGGQAEEAFGSMTLRWQPNTATPLTFFDVKARVQGTSTVAAVRGCTVSPELGLGIFGVLPMGTVPGGAQADALNLGLRYSSPTSSAGLVVNPGKGTFEKGWAVAKVGESVLVGVQTVPKMPILYGAACDARAATDMLARMSKATSYCVVYQLARRGQGTTSAAVEVREQQQLLISFLHHQAVQRKVHNPLEDSDVVGITNYLDVGFQITADLTGAGMSLMHLAAAWQANKNIMVKGRVGLDGVAAAAVFKSWWQPSFTLGCAAKYDFAAQKTRFGLTAAVETYSSLRYERSSEAQKMSGARVTQRHIASEQDVAYHKGRGLLVPLDEVDAVIAPSQQQPPGGDYL